MLNEEDHQEGQSWSTCSVGTLVRFRRYQNSGECRWTTRKIAWTTRKVAMLGWALTFLIVALIAAVLGFGGIAGFAVEIAKIIFFVAIILFVISAIFGVIRGRSPTVP